MNGNYVVVSSDWGGVGAVTWGSGTAGVSGTVSDVNSLVGSRAGDQVGQLRRDPLAGGDYVVASPYWNGGEVDGRGAATWGSGTTGVSGIVSAANSLIGSSAGDQVSVDGVTALANGNYVVVSTHWHGQAGAATWGDGKVGVIGGVSAANSLVGGDASFDNVGFGGVVALANGKYVIISPHWNGGRGAATWSSGATGITGTISMANSFIGANPSDFIGSGGATPLADGNYVIGSDHWNGGLIGHGAATWASGTSGQTLDGIGFVTPQNSLIGPTNAFFLRVFDDPFLKTFMVNFISFSAQANGQVLAGFVDPNLLTYGRGPSDGHLVLPIIKQTSGRMKGRDRAPRRHAPGNRVCISDYRQETR